MVTRVAVAAAMTAVACLTLSACSSTSTTTPQTATRGAATSASTVPAPTPSPTTTTRPPLTVAPDAATSLGADTVTDAWDELATWILGNGFRPELMSTTRPGEDTLASVYAFMTPTAAADLRAKVQAVYDGTADPGTIQAIETLITIGVTVPDMTLLPDQRAADGRTIDDATATIDTAGRLAITATSRAILHFAAADDPAAHSHADYKRTVTYALTRAGGGWVIDQWNGTYDTSNPEPD